jgi:hypothetical protein
MLARLQYAEGGPSLEVSLVYVWDRETMLPRLMSNSNGEKDAMRNDVWALLDREPAVDRVVLVRSGLTVFFLMRRRGSWFDVTGRAVVIRMAPRSEAAAGGAAARAREAV